MTKVQVEYELSSPLDEVLMDKIARAHGQYGITLIQVHESLTGIRVEYDASRLMRGDVAATLARLGIPAKEKVVVPPPAPEEPAGVKAEAVNPK